MISFARCCGVTFIGISIGICLSGVGLLLADEGRGAKTGPVPEDRAVLEIRLPEDATLEIQGVEIQLTGPVRQVRTAALDPDKTYSYTVRAAWKDGEQVKSAERKVTVRAGQRITVQIQEQTGRATGAPAGQAAADGQSAECALGRFLLVLQRLEPLLGSFDKLVLSPDLRYAVTHRAYGPCRLWDVTACREIRQFTETEYGTFTPAFSADGRRIAYLSGWDTVVVHEIRTGKDLFGLKAKRDRICHCVAFSPDGKSIAMVHDSFARPGSDIFVRNLDTGEVTATATPDTRVNFLSYTPDGKALLAAFDEFGGKQPLLLLDATTGQRRQTFLDRPACSYAAISPDGKRAVCQGQDGTVFALDLESGKELPPAQFRDSKPVLEALVKNLPKVPGPTACDLGRFFVELKRLEWTIGPSTAPHLSPDGRFVVTDHGRVEPQAAGRIELANIESFTRLWDVKQRREAARLPGFARGSRPVFSADGRRLVYGAADGTVRLWDTAAGVELRRLEPPKGLHVRGPRAISPDGRHLLVLASTGDSKQEWVGLWDMAAGKLLREFRLKPNIQDVGFSPDGRRFLTTGAWKEGESARDGVQLWDIDTGNEVRRFAGHENQVDGFAISPDGRRLLSGSRDGTVRLWDVESGKELFENEWRTPWVRGVMRTAADLPVISAGVRETPGVTTRPRGSSSGGGGGITIIVR